MDILIELFGYKEYKPMFRLLKKAIEKKNDSFGQETRKISVKMVNIPSETEDGTPFLKITTTIHPWYVVIFALRKAKIHEDIYIKGEGGDIFISKKRMSSGKDFQIIIGKSGQYFD